MAKEVEEKDGSWFGGGASERGRGMGGSVELRKRDGFSSHTSNYCVTRDWKGTAPGPREFARASCSEGAAAEGGKGRKGGIKERVWPRNSLLHSFFWVYLSVVTIEVNPFTTSPLPSSAQIPQPLTSVPLLLNSPLPSSASILFFSFGLCSVSCTASF